MEKQYNKEFQLWAGKLEKKGYTIKIYWIDELMYEGIAVYKNGSFKGEYSTPRQAYHSLLRTSF